MAAIPHPKNEPILSYLKNSPERLAVLKELEALKKIQVEVPLIIGGKEIKTGELGEIRIPHDHKHLLGHYHKARESDVKDAIANALIAKKKWAELPLEERVAVFLKAAELLSGPWRAKLIAATMLNQSKNYYQAEIDTACELIDFWNFNCKFAEELAAEQPISVKGTWNRQIMRPLEGFVYAISPFNFTAIGANLASAPAIVGNVCVWKPSDYAIYSNYLSYKLMQEAGLPDGVINFLPGDPQKITSAVLSDKNLAGLHYTGSTQVFRSLWTSIGASIEKYKNYPRLVGETGGKDFIFAHSSAKVPELVTALIRGAFEFAGQKCSSASRAYISKSIWPDVKSLLLEEMKSVKTGNPEDPSVLVNAVIHRNSFEKAREYIQYAKNDSSCEILHGGQTDDSVGYFIHPTVVLTTDPRNKLMQEEIFAPILTVFVYDDAEFEKTLEICDDSGYGLTGSIFATDRHAIVVASQVLINAAGNLYINDKPTGAVVGQQPFGGARWSGTNDKAGSKLNLLRWTSVQTIKETFVPPSSFWYPYMKE